MRRTAGAVAGSIFLLAIALAGCGGSTMTGSAGPTSASPSPESPEASGPGSGSAIVVERSGGIAGFHDVVEIAAGGSAQVTTRNGGTVPCQPDPAALDRLRAIDLAAVGSAPPKAPIPDGFNYTVRTQEGSATAGDGDVGVRAELAAAASAVVMSCLSSAMPPTS
jgi:hypothetical protein